VQKIIFTYYTEDSSKTFDMSIKSIAYNLIDFQEYELVIITKKEVPPKIIKALSALFLIVSQIKPSVNTTSVSDECVADVLIKYNQYDRWFVNPKLIISSKLPSEPSVNTFYKTDKHLLSTRLFFLKANSVIGESFSTLLSGRPATVKSRKISQEEFSFVILTNFMIDKEIESKTILTSQSLSDSQFDQVDVFEFAGLDTIDCLGGSYLKLDQTLTGVLQKMEGRVVPSTKKTINAKSFLPTGFLERASQFELTDSLRDRDRVSVIMTNYNCEDLVERAMQSVLSQTYQNVELLVIDDCSSDSSLEIITRVANSDSRVRVFRNIERRGTYWSKNSVLSKTTGSYITMIDSDDYDVPTRLEKQLAKFSDPDIVCVTCLNDRKISEKSDVSEKISLGYPSMMFKYSVFSELGYYDSTKFGADSEFYDRVIAVYGRSRIATVKEVLQICPRRTSGLTGVIPENSAPRLEYLKSYSTWHKSTTDLYLEFPQKTRKFKIPKLAEVEYTDLSNSVIVKTSSTTTLPVIMCVWKRVEGFKKTVEQLNSQTHKDFKLFVWNNNPDLEAKFSKILRAFATFEYEFYTSPKNIGGFGRFKYADKIRRNIGLLDFCVFVDDDQEFGPSLLSTFLSEATPNTILSQWAWEFKKLWYYGTDARRERLPSETVHYAGTGGMVADMRVFNSPGLFDCPIDYWFVEDLWLSFYANHYLKFSLYKSAAIMKNGDDIHSLYKVVKDVKTPMLIDLVNNFGWNILPKSEDPSAEKSLISSNIEILEEPNTLSSTEATGTLVSKLIRKIMNKNNAL